MENIMKKIFLASVLSLVSSLSYSADWTPVFQSWETKAENSAIMEKIRNHAFTGTWTSVQATLSKSAKQGNYSTIPQPYRADMLPARVSGEDVAEITIPLKNATLYGLPIQSLTMYSGLESGESGNYVTFKPMSNAQYQMLKQKKFKRVTDSDAMCDSGQAEVKKEKNTVYLVMDFSC